MKVEPIVRCSDCGSRDPHVTIGWPVCPNDDFHQEWEFKVPWWRKTYHRRPVLVASLLLALLPVAAYFSGKAHADPETVESYAFRNATAICGMLSNDDSDAGISEVINILVAHGVTPYQAGEVVGLSVTNVCPTYLDRVLDWAHSVTGVAPVWKASGQVGGVIA